MDNLLPENEYKEIEGRAYLNPEISLNEQNKFIENLRNSQAQRNQEIARQTYNLGTDIASVRGGLGTNNANGLSYFTSRLQIPQTNSVVADLRSAVQASALNQALQNEQEIWKKRYQDAYRNYQKRQNDKANAGSGGGGGGESDITTQATESAMAKGTMRSSLPGTTVTTNTVVDSNGNYGYDVVDNETGERLYSTEPTRSDSNGWLDDAGKFISDAVPRALVAASEYIKWSPIIKRITGLGV